MTISLDNVGTPVTGTGALSPAATFVAGQQIIVFTGENFLSASDTQTTPSGWTQLDFNTNAHQVRAFGLTSVTGAETIPSFTWGTASAWAFASVWNNIEPTFAVGGTPSDRASSSTSAIVSPAVTRLPTVDNCIVFVYGGRLKTATSNGDSYTVPAGFTPAFQMLAQSYPAGSAITFAVSYQIQLTAQTIAANQFITATPTNEGTGQNFQSGIIVLKPSLAVVAPPSSGGIFVCP